MSVLLEMAMFPIDSNESKSKEVSMLIETIKDSGYKYQLTAMGTLIETAEIEIIQKCYNKLKENGSNRIYSTVKFDIREGYENRIIKKVESIERNITKVAK
jgi:uncharacterized protein (TIGR00106 family)